MDLHAINQAARLAAYLSDTRVMTDWAKSVTVERDAVLLPQTRVWIDPEMPATWRGAPREIANGGVYAADGRIVPEAIHIGGTFRWVPDHWQGPPQQPRRLAGRWLYGGILRAHFGHFVLESLARLWAVQARDDLAGIVFLVFNGSGRAAFTPRIIRRRATEALAAPYVREMLGLLADRLSVEAVGSAVEIEELVIPAQLIGNAGRGDMSAGHPDFRAFMRRRLAHLDPPAGAPRRRLYVSRSALPPDCISFLFEAELEQALAEEGYEILRPETMSVTAQIAAYAAAAAIISPAGSALHLAAYAMNGHQRVAVIEREIRASTKFGRQLTLFGAGSLTTIARVVAEIGQPDARRSRYYRPPANIVDLDGVWADLLAAGFVARPRRFGLDAPGIQDAAMRVLAERLGRDDLAIIPIERRRGANRPMRPA